MQDIRKSVDAAIHQSLVAIAAIEPRLWPEGAPLYRFHESYVSDIVQIKKFCENREVFGRNSWRMEKNDDIITLLSEEVYLFYLPSILLAVTQYPQGRIATMLLLRARRTWKVPIRDSEALAIESVLRLLALFGSTPESLRAEIEQNRGKLREMRLS